MVGISSLDGSMANGVLDTGQVVKQKQVEDEELIQTKMKSGDTVTISAEAMTLFKSKLDEYGADDPSELSDKQKEDLKGTMDEFAKDHGLDPSKVEGMPPSPGGNGEGPPEGKGEGPPPEGAKGAGKAKGGEAAQGSTASSDKISDKEKEIEEKEAEIQELRAKSSTDEKAAESLKMKQSELALLQSELTMLKKNSA
ncbi:hypothetical protein SAMN05660337_1849 [Maridesulfovibrio ferrireducens]|uniref:Uncharacterized protein n=1 Tax=Maridesulfovibrio ferrireducens TaxID=246191 RepID=A0A1G9G648_9BACT|nr:hypothetical protein [Maridesulfovibrio ferrireducens]SDK96062.1 hypothetical protein SAMN05660337_1849 [Maridesulfovibrio ferrireducens]